MFPTEILLLSADNLFEATEAIRKEGEEDESVRLVAAPTSAVLSGFMGKAVDARGGLRAVTG